MAYVSAALCLTLFLALLAFRCLRHCPIFPPGPSGCPIIGNLLDIPTENEWVTYKNWSEKYNSEIVHASVFGSHIFVVNSVRVARELLDKRSSIYSDRPSLTAIYDLLDCNYIFAFMRYGDWWRDHRKVAHRWFHHDAVFQYREKALKAVQCLLSNLLLTPEQFSDHVQLLTGSLIIDIAYGVEVKGVDHPYTVNTEKFMKGVNFVVTPRGQMHDFFPLLSKIPSWMPGGGFNKSTRDFAPYGSKIINLPYEQARSDLERGKENSSIAAEYIRQAEKLTEHDLTVIKNSLATMYVAGFDTTTSSIKNFFRAMALFPECQQRAQEEIDRITQSKRLPSFGDMESMPYMKALCSEILRWPPVTTLAVPHVLIKDDVFEGYVLPKDSVVIPNVGAMLHDATTYPDPTSFNPERFLGPTPNPDPDVAFGFGRRICPGRYLARETIWITVASVLACFDISKAIDDSGAEVDIPLGLTGGLIPHPIPFKCSIRPRNASAVSLIESH